MTRAATAEAGSSAACVPNARRGWQLLLDAGGSDRGRQLISDAIQLCPHSEVRDKEDALALAEWLQAAWDYLAMVRFMQVWQRWTVSQLCLLTDSVHAQGNFPFRSGYVLNGVSTCSTRMQSWLH